MHFSPELFDHLEKRIDKKAKVSFKNFKVTDWETDNYNTPIAQYFKKLLGNHTMKFGQLIEYDMRNIFVLKNHTQNITGILLPNRFIKKQNLKYL